MSEDFSRITTKERTCAHPDCDRSFIPSGNRQKFCPAHVTKPPRGKNAGKVNGTRTTAPAPTIVKADQGKPFTPRSGDFWTFCNDAINRTGADQITLTKNNVKLTIERAQKGL